MQTEPVTVKQKKKLPKKLLMVVLVLVVALLAAGGVWYWQQSKIDEQKSQNDTLTQANQTLTEEKDALAAELTSSQATVESLNKELAALKSPEQATFSVTVDAAKHNGANYDSYNSDLLLVDLTIENTSDVEGYFSPESLQLKDSSDSIHPLCKNSAVGYYVCRTGVSLPSGKTELKAVSVQGGETVKGTVAFFVPKSTNDFTLRYNDQTLQINAQ